MHAPIPECQMNYNINYDVISYTNFSMVNV